MSSAVARRRDGDSTAILGDRHVHGQQPAHQYVKLQLARIVISSASGRPSRYGDLQRTYNFPRAEKRSDQFHCIPGYYIHSGGRPSRQVVGRPGSGVTASESMHFARHARVLQVGRSWRVVAPLGPGIG